jgi:hypothetical protein
MDHRGRFVAVRSESRFLASLGMTTLEQIPRSARNDNIKADSSPARNDNIKEWWCLLTVTRIYQVEDHELVDQILVVLFAFLFFLEAS